LPPGTAADAIWSHFPTPPGEPIASGTKFHYAEATTQHLIDDFAEGASATFTVELPGQVPGMGRQDHSLAEIAVESPALDQSFVEAGWIVENNNNPKLFVFWWKHGNPQCYNECGYVQDGRGLQPGTTLEVGSVITLKWRHHNSKWWLYVNGDKSGYYPDKQWKGEFTSTTLVKVFGEVAIDKGVPVCDDMGNGLPPTDADAASVTFVSFVEGPPVKLVKGVETPKHNYTVELTGDTSMRYGGPGDC
jgi:Neprosin